LAVYHSAIWVNLNVILKIGLLRLYPGPRDDNSVDRKNIIIIGVDYAGIAADVNQKTIVRVRSAERRHFCVEWLRMPVNGIIKNKVVVDATSSGSGIHQAVPIDVIGTTIRKSVQESSSVI